MKLKKCFPKLKQKKNSIEKETKKFQPNNKIKKKVPLFFSAVMWQLT
jgi:hypothetical protein